MEFSRQCEADLYILSVSCTVVFHGSRIRKRISGLCLTGVHNQVDLYLRLFDYRTFIRILTQVLNACACVRVRTCACIRVRACACVRISAYARVRVRACTRARVRVRTCACARVRVRACAVPLQQAGASALVANVVAQGFQRRLNLANLFFLAIFADVLFRAVALIDPCAPLMFPRFNSAAFKAGAGFLTRMIRTFLPCAPLMLMHRLCNGQSTEHHGRHQQSRQPHATFFHDLLPP